MNARRHGVLALSGAALLLTIAAMPASAGPAGLTGAASAATVTFELGGGRGPVAHCDLKTGITYLRTSGAKQVVGFKPRVDCQQTMDRISLTGQMYAEVGGAVHPYGDAPTSVNTGQVTLENRRIGYNCAGPTSTRWLGRATVTAVWHGIPKTATASTSLTPLPCAP